jgi:ABC-2 type transport system ATP-binding protein
LELAQALRELARDGHTILFSSHTLSEVEQLCDRVAIVRRGRIVADESLDEMRGRARRVVQLRFQDADTAATTAAPDFLQLVSREADQWRCELVGAAQPLVHWAANQPIVDLDVGKPELETVFRSYYSDTGDG